MIDAYKAIAEQLAHDIADVLPTGSEIVFGPLRRDPATPSYAVVLTSVEREWMGPRSVEVAFTFEIALMLEVPDGAYPDGYESYLLEVADALIERLAPYSTTTVPAPLPDYAGAYGREVRSVEVLPSQDDDARIGVRLQFSCRVTVYQ